MLSVTRNEVDVVMAWSVDRLGRSVQHLAGLLSDLHSKGVNLYLHQQGLDTTTPSGKAMFQMMGVFAEFEREMIRERINAGLARAKEQGTKTGAPIGRPKVPLVKINKVKKLRRQGMTYKKIALTTGLSERKCYEIMAGA
jgi:DNA invertase Pin-like site-specific DNA recombinase